MTFKLQGVPSEEALRQGRKKMQAAGEPDGGLWDRPGTMSVKRPAAVAKDVMDVEAN